MGRYILKRLWHTVYVVVGISIISFFFIHLSGDPVMLMLPPDATKAEIETLRQQLGFNDPLVTSSTGGLPAMRCGGIWEYRSSTGCRPSI